MDQILKSREPPARAWDQAFQTRRYAPSVLAEAIFLLHGEGKYDVAVEGLLSSLRNDHAQMWTYDVLAAEMSLAGRPVSEIQRVVESRVDFASTSIPQLMVTAAMLTRMDAHDAALEICRAAAERNPWVPEPWLLGRNIADRAQKTEGRVWARCGLLRYIHSDSVSADRREAKETLRKLIDSAVTAEQASEIREMLDQADAIDLRIVLKWVGAADLDLLVEEPGGSRCDLKQRITPNGGQLIREDGGSGQRRNGQRVEEYICHTAPPGDYTAIVRFVFGDVVAGSAVLEVTQHANTPQEKRETYTVRLSRTDARQTVSLSDGRRAVEIER